MNSVDSSALNPSQSPDQKVGLSRLKKVAAWIVVAFGVLFLVITLVAVAVLHSARFHRYVLSKVQQQASDALGVQVQLQEFALHLSTLGLDLYGITVHGASPFPDPPLLQVEHVAVGVRVVSVFRRQWYLDLVQIDRPVIKVLNDAEGRSNIPTLKSSGNSSSNTSLFDLGIRRAVLSGGQAFYNNRQSALDADLHDLQFNASFDPVPKRYSGRLSYSDGHLASGSLRQIPHSLDATFESTPDSFQLTQAKLTSGPSQILLSATLNNYADPDVHANYEALVEGSEFRQILNNSTIPSGTLRAIGQVHYHQSANQPLLEAIDLKGDLSSQRLNAKTAALSAPLTNILAHYALSNGDATLQDFRLNLLGGTLTASGKMSKLGGASHSEVQAALRGLSLRELNRSLAKSALPAGAALDGAFNAEATATWGKTLDDLVANLGSTIKADVTRSDLASTGSIPIDSVIHGRYTGRDQQLALAKSYVRTPQTTLTLDGVMSRRSSLNVALDARDLHEVETIAALFQPSSQSAGLHLSGSASFRGALQGSTTAPHLSGKFNANSLGVRGTVVRRLETTLDLSPSSAALQNATLDLASRGHMNLDARTALTDWSFQPTSPLEVRLDASQISLADILQLAGQQLPVSGSLNAKLTLHGTQLNPVGQGSVSLDKTIVYDQPIDSAKLTFDGTGEEVHGNLGVQLPAGGLQGQISLHPRQKSYTAALSVEGLHLDQLQIVKSRSMNVTGVLTAKATGQGTFDNPGLDATVTVPQLVAQAQSISGTTLHLVVANHLANATLASSAVNTSLRANAKVALTGDFPADATLDTQNIPLQPILAAYAPAQAADITGETELHATLHGPLKDKKRLEAHVTIPVLKLAYRNSVQLAAVSPIRIDYKDNVVALQRVGVRGTDTDLQMQASFPLQTNAPISALLLGTVNLQLAQLFDPDIRTSGEMKFNIDSYGAASSSDIGGQIDIVDASYSSLDLPVGLQHGNGVITLTKDRVNITKFEGTVGGGTVTAHGGVNYQPNLQFDLGVSAKRIRLLYPQGLREGVDADVRLTGSTDSALLGGTISLSELSFTPAFDLNNFIGQFSGGITPPPSQGFSQNLQLNLAVRSTNDVNLVSRTVSINGSANLQVRGTAAEPVILGRVNLNNGDIILNGERFVLNGGTIEFVNPAETQPVVNLSLYTTIQEYNVYLRFNGPINQLHTNYSSDPALPSADIINLLAFGKTTEANSANPSTPANQAAESLIASQVSSQVTSRVSKIAGISQLSISPVLAGGTSQGPPGANITIQQRVTGNLFITFSSNVASTQNQTIQGQYQLTPKIAISGTRDQNGGFAMDGLIKNSW